MSRRRQQAAIYQTEIRPKSACFGNLTFVLATDTATDETLKYEMLLMDMQPSVGEEVDNFVAASR